MAAPGSASYTKSDLANAVTVLARGYRNASVEWGRALTTVIGATSEAVRSFEMERHVSIGLNILTKGAVHFPPHRTVSIMWAWSKISKSIKRGEYNFVLKYMNRKGTELIEETLSWYSAGQMLAVINSKDGTKEGKNAEKENHGQKYEGKGKGKMKDFKADKENERNLKETQKGSQKTQSKGGKRGHTRSFWQKCSLTNVLDGPGDKEMRIYMGNPSFDVSDEIKNYVQADEFEDDTVDFNFQDLTYGQYLEKMHKKYPPFDYSRAPEPLPVTWIPRRAYIPSDSDSESEEKSEKDSKRAHEVEYEEEEEKMKGSTFQRILACLRNLLTRWLLCSRMLLTFLVAVSVGHQFQSDLS